MREIALDAVQTISRETLTYRAKDGRLTAIRLADCAKAWEALHPERKPGKCRCVGTRRFEPPVAYYELAGPEPIRLVQIFPGPAWLRRWMMGREYSYFHRVQQMLNCFGWTTLDLS